MRARSIHATWTCLIVLALASAQAQTYNVAYSFKGAPGGANPYSALIHDAAGNFYGTTFGGGAYGHGSVFKIDTTGRETVLYSFTGGSDGAKPLGALRRDQNGDFHGTASAGGKGGRSCPPGGCGVVYKLDSSGSETVLYRFKGNLDGFAPVGALVADGAGNLYGSTEGGGSFGVGTVFRLDATGNETILLNFTGTNGSNPSGLVRDQAGNLFGTTATGGSGAGCIGGCGNIFKLDPGGHQTVLYNFAGTSDGAFPSASLLRDAAGNLYSTTFAGGKHGFGTIFRLNANGTFKVLYSFRGTADGGNPISELLRDKKGNLYGTATDGGTGSCRAGCGVVFRLNPDGTEIVLHSFMGGPKDGSVPFSGLVAGPGASLHGTTYLGGADNKGTVFELHN